MEASAEWLEALYQLAKRDKQKLFPSSLLYANASEKGRKRKRYKNAVHYVYIWAKYWITWMLKYFFKEQKQKCFRSASGFNVTYTQGWILVILAINNSLPYLLGEYQLESDC